MSDYPASIVPVNHVEPVPRRVRAMVGADVVLDTTRALYVWEVPYYPQFYIPRDDVRADMLVADGKTEDTPRGPVDLHTLTVGVSRQENAAKVLTDSTVPDLAGTVRFEWEALERWFEEDEEIFVHPRSPYARVDALRSRRTVRIELDGIVLAESAAPVMVFETGLPTRYYLDPTEVDFTHLVATDTASQCPYKGRTTGYWSATVNGAVYDDLAWVYHFPTRQLQPIAGLIAFYNEKVDVFLDGTFVDRPNNES